MTEQVDSTLFNGLLDSLSTGAARASMEEKAAGHSIDVYLWETMRAYFESRYQRHPSWPRTLNVTPQELAAEDTKNFLTGLANEGLYNAWRQSAIEKVAKLSVVSQKAA